MKKNNIGYLLREGIRGVFLHGFMSFAAIWVTVASLLIMGTFSLVLFNLNEMILDLEQDNQVLVYIDETYSTAEAKSVGSQINMIIADEPTGNLDPARSLEIMRLLEQINALGTTVMVVTHEKDLVDRFTKRVIVIDEGQVVSDGMDGYYAYEEE